MFKKEFASTVYDALQKDSVKTWVDLHHEIIPFVNRFIKSSWKLSTFVKDLAFGSPTDETMTGLIQFQVDLIVVTFETIDGSK